MWSLSGSWSSTTHGGIFERAMQPLNKNCSNTSDQQTGDEDIDVDDEDLMFQALSLLQKLARECSAGAAGRDRAVITTPDVTLILHVVERGIRAEFERDTIGSEEQIDAIQATEQMRQEFESAPDIFDLNVRSYIAQNFSQKVALHDDHQDPAAAGGGLQPLQSNNNSKKVLRKARRNSVVQYASMDMNAHQGTAPASASTAASIITPTLATTASTGATAANKSPRLTRTATCGALAFSRKLRQTIVASKSRRHSITAGGALCNRTW